MHKSVKEKQKRGFAAALQSAQLHYITSVCLLHADNLFSQVCRLIVPEPPEHLLDQSFWWLENVLLPSPTQQL